MPKTMLALKGFLYCCYVTNPDCRSSTPCPPSSSSPFPMATIMKPLPSCIFRWQPIPNQCFFIVFYAKPCNTNGIVWYCMPNVVKPMPFRCILCQTL